MRGKTNGLSSVKQESVLLVSGLCMKNYFMKAAAVLSGMLSIFASDIYILLIIMLISCVMYSVTHTYLPVLHLFHE